LQHLRPLVPAILAAIASIPLGHVQRVGAWPGSAASLRCPFTRLEERESERLPQAAQGRGDGCRPRQCRHTVRAPRLAGPARTWIDLNTGTAKCRVFDTSVGAKTVHLSSVAKRPEFIVPLWSGTPVAVYRVHGHSPTAGQAAVPQNPRLLAHHRPCWSEPLFDELLGHQPVWCKGQDQDAPENRNRGAAGGRAFRGATAPSRSDGMASWPRWAGLPVQQRHPASTAPHLASVRDTHSRGRRNGIDEVRGDSHSPPQYAPELSVMVAWSGPCREGRILGIAPAGAGTTTRCRGDPNTSLSVA